MTKNSDLYRRLQKHLDQFPIGFPSTESGVDIKLLEHLFSEQEAQITIKLGLIAAPVEKIHRKLKHMNISQADLSSMLEKMEEKGLISGFMRRDGVRFFNVAFLAIGIFEYQVELMTKEFYQLFKQYLDEAFRDEILKTKIPQLRTIPIEGSIAPDLPIAQYDHIRTLIDDFKKEIAVAKCVCKIGQDGLEKPCKATEEREICLVFGSAAKRYERLGWARMISKEEVFKIIDTAEKDGLVLQPSNTQKLFAMCLCCGCCCEILTSAKPLDNPIQYFSTNYQAVVNPSTCKGCKICMKRCQMDAVTVTNKKATVDETRCIGCGVCVPTCKQKSMQLRHIDQPQVPPENALQLYSSIMKKKLGRGKYMIMLTKQILGNLI